MTNTLTTLTTADRPAPVDDLDRVLQAFRRCRPSTRGS